MQRLCVDPARADASLICIPPADVPKVWPHVCDLIDAAYAAVDEIMPDLADDFASAKCLLWVAWGAEGKVLSALTTRLVKYRRGLVCRLVACGGDSLQRWSEFHRQIEQYARNEKCVSVRIDGRAGWARALSGYERVSVTLEKRL